jgi:hypothetical protein
MYMSRSGYDAEKLSKAETKAAMRAIVAGYLGYLGYKIATEENTSMKKAAALIIGAFFFIAAAAVGAYTVYCFLTDRKAARLAPEAAAEDSEE